MKIEGLWGDFSRYSKWRDEKQKKTNVRIE
jgi:hypothetical protein